MMNGGSILEFIVHHSSFIVPAGVLCWEPRNVGKVEDMISQDKEALVALLTQNGGRVRSLGVKRLGLFGSYVRGEQTDESDVDLLVEFEKDKKSFDNFMALAFLLEDLLHRRVELVTPESVSPYIRPYIVNEVEYVALVA